MHVLCLLNSMQPYTFNLLFWTMQSEIIFLPILLYSILEAKVSICVTVYSITKGFDHCIMFCIAKAYFNIRVLQILLSKLIYSNWVWTLHA